MRVAIFGVIVWGLASVASAQTCDQTLSVGGNVAASVESAANGSTICLNSGNYGTVNIANVSRSGFVTVRSTSGREAQLTLGQVWASSFIKFDSLTFGYASVNNNSHHVEFWNSTFAPNGDGLVFNLETVPATDTAFVVDGCTFDRVSTALFSGRLSVRGVRGLKIRNSIFSGGATGDKADGVMLVGNAQDVEIGPGNVFRDILQAVATNGEHVDSIQMFGAGPNNKIIGNYFHNADVFIMAPDGTSSVTVENNVFDGSAVPYLDKIQFGSADNAIFRHNTVRNTRVSFDSKPGESASSNALAENNVLVGSTTNFKTSSGNGCTGCTFRFNLFDDSGDSRGTDNLIGAPAFVGGSSPTSYAGWALAAGSLGKGAGNDDLDMGIVGNVQIPDPDPDPEPDPDPDPAPEQIIVGVTAIAFDHDGENTDSYELCAVVAGTEQCIAVPGTSFTMPEWQLGTFAFYIKATGPSGSTNGPTTTFEVVAPAPPPPPAPTAPSAPRIPQ